MTTDQPHNHPDQPEPPRSEQVNPVPPNPAPPRKRRWLRRTLIGVGIVVLLLLILLALAPTIASMGWARNIAVNKINQNLNGHVQIADWSLGWTNGIKVDGIKVFDDQNRQILQISHVSTQLSLLNAARGNYEVGQTVVDSPDFNIVRYPDGTTNLQKLKKTGAPAASSAPSDQSTKPKANAGAAPPAENKQEQNEPPIKLPNMSGELKLVNGRGTVETITANPQTKQEQHDMVKFTSIQGDVKIPSIDQPITDSIQIVEVPGNSLQSGTLDVSGQILIAKNRQLLAATEMSGNQQIALSAVELSGFAPFAPPTITALAGNTDGKITLTLTPGQGDVLEGKITSQNFKLGGPILSGDTYVANSAVIDIPKTTLSGNPKDYHIKIGDGSQQAITLTLNNAIAGQQPSQSTVKLIVDANAKALQNLGNNQKPGGTGLVHADVDLDLIPLAQMLPHMLHMMEDVKLSSGRIANTLDIQLTPDRANLSQSLSIANVAGAHADGKPIKLEPINQSFKAVDLCSGGKVPDLRDMSLVLTTSSDPSAGWASANISAPSIGQIKGQIHAALDRAQQQLGQIIDFGTTKMGGALDVVLTSNGDLIGDEKNPNQTLTSDLTANTTLQNLSIDGMAGKKPIHEPFIGLNSNVTLVRGKEMFVQNLRNFATKLVTGDQQHPSIDATIGGNIDFSQRPSTDPADKGKNETVPTTKDMQYAAKIDLPRLQNEFGAFLIFLCDSQIQNGQATAGGTIVYDQDHLAIVPKLEIRDLLLHNADGDEPIGSVDLNAKQLVLLMSPSPAASGTTQPSFMAKVRELQVDQLVAGVTGAQLTVNGSITDLAGARQLKNMGADLTYDAPKLWTIIYPMLSKKSQEQFKDAKVAGSYARHITLSGSYPNVDTTKDPKAKLPIESLFAAGDLIIDQFDGAGASIAKLDIPFILNNGFAVVAIVGKPPGQDMPQPASFNGGTLDLGGIYADMKDPHLRLTMSNGKKLLNNVSLNPAFARLFGDWINNPMFVSADNAAGQLSMIINQCAAFPLDKSVMDRSPSNTGVMDISMTLNRVQLGNQLLSNIAQQTQGILGNSIALQSLQGDIPKLHVHIEHGITKEEMTMTFGEGKRPLNLNGDVVMDSRQMNMMLDLPPDLLGVGKNNPELSFLSNNGLQIPLGGTVDHPQFDAGKAVQANLGNAPQQLIKGLLGKQNNQNNKDQPTSRPAKEKDNNPIDQLQDLLNRNKKK